jgi:hypothetical protein
MERGIHAADEKKYPLTLWSCYVESRLHHRS